ncbi:pyridoxamine 5'-phosphate oxidase family protein [bacterium]|nr:pyridoxamine 5'-phosphate oxidase family protein [bacterium]
MSVAVPLEKLRGVLAERGGGAYLLTVGDDASPHAVHVQVAWDGDALVTEVGRRSAANAAARPSVSLLFPLRSADDYSVIVDGTAAAAAGGGERRLRVAPLRAVLHRPAAAPDPGASCGADCVPLLSPAPKSDR